MQLCFANPEYDNKIILKHLKHFISNLTKTNFDLTWHLICVQSLFDIGPVVLEIFKIKCVNVFFAIMLLFPIKEGSLWPYIRTDWNSSLPKYPLFQVWLNCPIGSADENVQWSSVYFHHFAFIPTPIPIRNGCSLSRTNLNPTFVPSWLKLTQLHVVFMEKSSAVLYIL